MQPTHTSRPVMDITARTKAPPDQTAQTDSSVAPVAISETVPVQKAPEEALGTPTAATQELPQQPSQQPDTRKTTKASPSAGAQASSSSPAGIIIITVLIMAALSALAVMVYMQSNS